MAKRRHSKRRNNPNYSDAVFNAVNDFVNVLDKVSNEGYKTAKKIIIKQGNIQVGRMVEGIAVKLRNMSEILENKLDD